MIVYEETSLAHEIFNRIVSYDHRVLIILSSSKNSNRESANDMNYLEEIASRNELFFPLLSVRSCRALSHSDVVIENVSKFPMIWPLILAKLLSKPYIIIVHHIHGRTLFKELPPPIAFIFYIYEILSLKLYSLLGVFAVAVSNSTKGELVRLGFPKERVLVISCGANFKFENNCNDVKSRELLIVYVGRVKRYKRVDHLIKAMRIVVERVPNARCIIAGKGDAKVYEELRSLTEKLGLGNRTVFKEEITKERKVELLRRA